MAAEQQLTRKVVVDTLVEVNDDTAAMLSTKGRRLRWALIFLGATALMLAMGILVTASEGGSL